MVRRNMTMCFFPKFPQKENLVPKYSVLHLLPVLMAELNADSHGPFENKILNYLYNRQNIRSLYITLALGMGGIKSRICFNVIHLFNQSMNHCYALCHFIGNSIFNLEIFLDLFSLGAGFGWIGSGSSHCDNRFR